MSTRSLIATALFVAGCYEPQTTYMPPPPVPPPTVTPPSPALEAKTVQCPCWVNEPMRVRVWTVCTCRELEESR